MDRHDLNPMTTLCALSVAAEECITTDGDAHFLVIVARSADELRELRRRLGLRPQRSARHYSRKVLAAADVLARIEERKCK
jgi:hypothetical protein